MCEDREELHQCEKCDINVRKMKAMRKKCQQHEKSTAEAWKEHHSTRKPTCKLQTRERSQCQANNKKITINNRRTIEEKKNLEMK